MERQLKGLGKTIEENKILINEKNNIIEINRKNENQIELLCYEK